MPRTEGKGAGRNGAQAQGTESLGGGPAGQVKVRYRIT